MSVWPSTQGRVSEAETSLHVGSYAKWEEDTRVWPRDENLVLNLLALGEYGGIFQSLIWGLYFSLWSKFVAIVFILLATYTGSPLFCAGLGQPAQLTFHSLYFYSTFIFYIFWFSCFCSCRKIILSHRSSGYVHSFVFDDTWAVGSKPLSIISWHLRPIFVLCSNIIILCLFQVWTIRHNSGYFRLNSGPIMHGGWRMWITLDYSSERVSKSFSIWPIKTASSIFTIFLR